MAQYDGLEWGGSLTGMAQDAYDNGEVIESHVTGNPDDGVRTSLHRHETLATMDGYPGPVWWIFESGSDHVISAAGYLDEDEARADYARLVSSETPASEQEDQDDEEEDGAWTQPVDFRRPGTPGELTGQDLADAVAAIHELIGETRDRLFYEEGPHFDQDFDPWYVIGDKLAEQPEAALTVVFGPHVHPNMTSPQDALLGVLRELAETYPTDEDGAPTTRITIGGQDVEMTAGQLSWLTGLVMDELATNRNAHADGNGQCAHCAGTGRTHAHR